MKRMAAALDLESGQISTDGVRSNWRELLTNAVEACQSSAAAIGAQCERIAHLEMSGLRTDEAEETLSRMLQVARQNHTLLCVLLQSRDLPADPIPAD